MVEIGIKAVVAIAMILLANLWLRKKEQRLKKLEKLMGELQKKEN